MDDLRQDVAYALRTATRTPLFSLMAVLALALGVGANAAVFGVVKSVLLDPLPYADDDRLVRIYGRASEGVADRSALSAGAVADLAQRQRSFEQLATFYPTTWEVIYRPADGPRVLIAGGFAAGFLETLGVGPVWGRSFARAETPRNGAYVVMLSYDVWRQDFGEDPGVIGRSIRVDADTWQVVGVMPPGFLGPMGSADLWFNLDPSASLTDPVQSRQSAWLGAVARLNPGVTVVAADRELSSIAADLAREYPDLDAGGSVSVVSLRDSMVGDTRTPLLVLMASALLVLCLTCANLAGSLLSRAITRRGEFALRVALGAGRGRLLRQLLTESTVLAVGGSIVGLLLASVGLEALRYVDVPALPAYANLSLDNAAIVTAALVALCTGVAMGIVPAWSAFRSSAEGVLRGSARSASEGHASSRLRGALLSAQIALSLSLLVGAGLLTRSLVAMTGEPLGFDPDRVLTVSVKGPIPEQDAVRKQFFAELEERVRALPNVVGVANTSQLPGPTTSRSELVIQGTTWPVETVPPLVPFVTVSDDWFRTMRIPLLRGRSFGPQDAPGTTPVAVISETMADTYWPGDDAIGARIRLGDPSSPWFEVVGVVGDIRTDPTRIVPEPVAYGAAPQGMMRESRIYAIRTLGDPLALTGPLQAELTGLDPSVPMNQLSTLGAIVDANLNTRRLPALLMTTFAALALVLATGGVYALFANLAAAREQEFGIRMALGSSRAAIAWLIVRHGAAWTVVGLAGGLIGVAAMGYALRELLYRTSPHDPLTIGLAVVALAASGAIALLIPVRRASRMDPQAILR